MCSEFSRWKDAEYPDIGPVEGPIPEEVDCVIVGAGIAGTEPQDRPLIHDSLLCRAQASIKQK